MHVTTFQAKQAGNMTTKYLEEAARMLRPNSSRRGGKQGKHAQSGVRAHARTDVWTYIDAPDVQNGSCRRTPSQVDSSAHALPRSGTRVNMFLRMHVTTFQAKQSGNMTTKDLEEAARMLRPNSSRRGGKQGKHAQSG